MKCCTKCRRPLPLTSFSKDRTRPDGHRLVCRECDNRRRQRCLAAAYWTPERVDAYHIRLAERAARIADAIAAQPERN